MVVEGAWRGLSLADSLCGALVTTGVAWHWVAIWCVLSGPDLSVVSGALLAAAVAVRALRVDMSGSSGAEARLLVWARPVFAGLGLTAAWRGVGVTLAAAGLDLRLPLGAGMGSPLITAWCVRLAGGGLAIAALTATACGRLAGSFAGVLLTPCRDVRSTSLGGWRVILSWSGREV